MLYPTIGELTKGDFNRYELSLATARCARIVTDEYIEMRNKAQKMIDNHETDKPLAALIDPEYKDQKAVKIAIAKLKETINSGNVEAIKADTKEEKRTSPYWLIFTYLILTFAELLLSPMGISFVSKVAPPKLKGLMMGGWFVATAFGNMLVAVGGFLWAGIPLWSVWTVFIVLCLLSALFMFVMMKRLESATK